MIGSSLYPFSSVSPSLDSWCLNLCICLKWVSLCCSSNTLLSKVFLQSLHLKHILSLICLLRLLWCLKIIEQWGQEKLSVLSYSTLLFEGWLYSSLKWLFSSSMLWNWRPHSWQRNISENNNKTRISVTYLINDLSLVSYCAHLLMIVTIYI